MNAKVLALKNGLLGSATALGRFGQVIYRNKKAFAGAIILLIFAFLALLGRAVFPYGDTTSFDLMYMPPSLKYWLGTDGMGRDLFRMIVHGTRDVMSIAFMTAALTVGLGTVVGMVAGYAGKWPDRVIGMAINLVMSIPVFPILLILSMFVTVKDNFTLAVMLSVFSWPGTALAVRAQIVSLRERDFIQICRVMGLSAPHVIFSELLPNIFSFLVVSFIGNMKNALTASVGLMTLGLALFEPTNWGGILVTARNAGAFAIPAARICILAPVAAIVLFQIGAILLSNGLDEAINPRLREKA